MTRSSYRAEQATRVLRALDSGKPASRPASPPRGVATKLCRDCQTQIYFASLQSGQRVPLERHPEGHVVLVDGVVRYNGPETPNATRYVFHRCQVKEQP